MLVNTDQLGDTCSSAVSIVTWMHAQIVVGSGLGSNPSCRLLASMQLLSAQLI